jgi:hypothetical protein
MRAVPGVVLPERETGTMTSRPADALMIQALGRALLLQLDVVRQLQPKRLLSPSLLAGWTVRDGPNHSVAITSKFTDFAAGRTDILRTPRGDLLGADYLATLAETVNLSMAAVGRGHIEAV